MKDIALQRCNNHGQREAVARCPKCRRYFCRECITEHEDRVLCASCLSNIHNQSLKRPSKLYGLARIIQFLVGGTVIWMFFYYLGQVLLGLPSSFHEGTLWQSGWWD